MIFRTKNQLWEIMKLEGVHTCASPMISQDHNKLGYQMIAQSIHEIIQVDPFTPVLTIITHMKALEDAQSKENAHTMLSFDRRNTKFLVEKRQNRKEVRPPDRFAIRLDELWCDCGKFQKLHLPCFHVFAACKNAHHDFARYISLVYTLQQVFHVYEGLFGKLKNEEY